MGTALGNQMEYEFAQFPAHALPVRVSSTPRKLGPIRSESDAVPSRNRFILDEDQCPSPARPEPPQHHPEQILRSCEPRLRIPLFQNGGCCREAGFSNSRSRRERKMPIAKAATRFSKRNMRPILGCERPN